MTGKTGMQAGTDDSASPSPLPAAHAAPRKGSILRWLGIAILAAVAVALAVAFILPRHAVVTRSVEIATPPAAVFPLAGDLRRFNEWSPWADLDPNTVFTFTGAVDGVGQRLHWQSEDPRVGSGTIAIAGMVPDSRVDMTIDFADAGTALASITLEPAGAGTRVTWGFDSDLGFNPVARYFGMMADGAVGPDYEKGLGRLKALAEAAPAPDVADE